ncbi:2-C-methyl-D-erythritol 4-phosphate cytidylyltransferase [Dysgonomonas sp. PH5-45]|uniref:2-C-methyl-D-erythritol 4-phosphate cytidylyltransferase n=1 Tax=unclassified Dysgonomonas TaxID=2630389 RepID=UPI002475EA45|nr:MULTISPECIES: 2-C-methyl-D-erythritol 4-phosphate cytidylyltransferase [unclassified Dysgonomonas]MDH6354848.1 2-C-methyl-D-erythritol 4-phosphate cytidylyltransferase [Dysgonomonas sp. PH5-45]MDH6387747.1 2-C-methyl-D-erythritol 4-phosphate cytidylyltransferase [Dysgonomonas sp. PH5-37]
MEQQNSVIIVAGGKGLRMGHDLPKQFIAIGGKPVLMHTIDAFYGYDNSMQIVLVLAPDYVGYWQKLCDEYAFDIPHVITTGGETRYHSVKNGLQLATGQVIAVHDAARPFVSEELIGRCFGRIKEKKAIIPAIAAVDSLREVQNDGNSHIIDRGSIRMVQTPQVFLADILKEAYKTDYNPAFTDDASVVEAIGINVCLVEGEPTNIKITTPLDLEVAKLLLANKGDK